MAISRAMKRHLQQNVTTLCSIWAVQSVVDGTILRSANHVRSITYQSHRYIAFPLKPSELQRRSGLSPDNLELVGTLRRGGITESDILSGRWKGAALEMNVINFNDVTMGPARKIVANLGVITIGNGYFKAEVKGQMHKLSQPVGRIYGRLCDVKEFGDIRCDPDQTILPNYTFAAAVTAVTDRSHFTVNLSPAKPDHYFAAGQVIFTDHRNKNIKMDVKESVGNDITLFQNTLFPLAVGDHMNLIFGCDRKQVTCASVVNAENPSLTNAENHQGFSNMPTADDVYNFPA